MGFIELLNIAVNWTAIILTLMLVMGTMVIGNLKEKFDFWLFTLVLITFAGVATDSVLMLIIGTPGRGIGVLIRILDWLSFVIPGAQCAVFAKCFYEYMKERVKVKKTPYIAMQILGLLTVIMATIAEPLQLYLVFDASNNYITASTIWISNVFTVPALVIQMFVTLKYKRNLTKREFVSLMLYTIVPVFCNIIETMVEYLWLGYFGTAVVLFIVFVNLQIELRLEKDAREAELAQTRISIMLSQIQPHFLYNSLTAIMHLCNENEQALEALQSFSEYLRGNMDSLTENKLVMFDKELEHVKNYLLLEKLRFEEKLKINYNLQTEDFLLPSLTLQPLVENAIRHGLNKKPEGGTVTISSSETATDFLVFVIDDGVGFVVGEAKEDGRSHIGISNVQGRLAAMCDGVLTIESAQNKGTIATIAIPKKK